MDGESSRKSGRNAPRASKACTRCRRMRIKCVPQAGEAESKTCRSCAAQGLASECHFLPRGYSAADREYRKRHPYEANKANGQNPTSSSPRASTSEISLPQEQQLYDILPPVPEIIEAIQRYITSYFQIGFFHKVLFTERVKTRLDSVSPFLLTAVCAVAAPFTPSLVARYGSKVDATDHFMVNVQKHLGMQMMRPSLEAVQAFLLLGIVEWGRGRGAQAWMMLGTAIRMSGFLGLHKEVTYRLTPNPTSEQIIDAEIARRTFWALACHESLLAGQSRPVQLSLADIDALLPCDEADFMYGIEPKYRAALLGTSAVARVHSETGSCPQSLFGSLVRSKHLWSLTARHASRVSLDLTPDWHTETFHLLREWDDFENGLPERQQYSTWNLRGMVAEGLELPFLTLSLLARLSRIVLRRLHISSLASDGILSAPVQAMSQDMADGMVRDAQELLSRVEECLSLRPLDLGFPPILLFGIYMCGLVFSLLVRWPEFCSVHCEDAQTRYDRSVHILLNLSDAWPLAAQWHDSLVKAASIPNGDGHRLPPALVASISPNDAVETGIHAHHAHLSSQSSTPRVELGPRDEASVRRLHEPLFRTSRHGSINGDWPQQGQDTLEEDNVLDHPIIIDTFDTFNLELSQFLASNTASNESDPNFFPWES